jgi:hypothetical protein
MEGVCLKAAVGVTCPADTLRRSHSGRNASSEEMRNALFGYYFLQYLFAIRGREDVDHGTEWMVFLPRHFSPHPFISGVITRPIASQPTWASVPV